VSSNGNYVPLRRGILQHIRDGRLSHSAALGYVIAILEADKETGLWWGSAKLLAGGYGFKESTARRVLEVLEDRHYIKRFPTPGQHGNYPVLVNKYVATHGAKQGLRVNAVKTTDWHNPVFERAEQDAEVNAEVSSPFQESKKATRQERVKGERVPSPVLKPATDYAHKTLTEKFGQKPAWEPRQFKALADLLRHHPDITLEEFTARWDRYLADQDHFVKKQGHSLTFFCSRFDTYVRPGAKASNGVDPRTVISPKGFEIYRKYGAKIDAQEQNRTQSSPQR